MTRRRLLGLLLASPLGRLLPAPTAPLPVIKYEPIIGGFYAPKIIDEYFLSDPVLAYGRKLSQKAEAITRG